MNFDWQTFALGDCLDALIDYRGKTPKKTNSGIPLITAKIIKGGRIQKAKEFIAFDNYESWMSRGIPKCGDVVLTVEAPLGEVAQLGPEKIALAQRVVTLRGKSGVLDSSYLLYWLQSNEAQEKLKARATGTTVIGIKQSELRKVTIPIPPLKRQQFVARILSLIDDQIALLRETNSTLEAISQALFKSWFIDFDPILAKQEGKSLEGIDKATASLFPNSFEQSELGDIPKGWKVSNLGDIAYRHVHKVKDFDDWANLPLIDLARINPKQLFNENYGIGSELNTSVTRFEKGDILFGAIRPYFHKVSLSQVDGVTNVSVFVIRPKEEINYAFLVNLLYLNTTVDFAVRLSKGTKMPVISWPDLSTLKIILPPELIMESFNEKIIPFIKKGLENAASIKILADIRDSLLPRLISGQLSLSEDQIERAN